MENFSLDIKAVEDKLGYTFKQKNLLTLAMTHSSYVNEHLDQEIECNERLEFLGDAVLDIIIADYLYLNYPDKSEGMLSNLRSRLVEAQTCTQFLQKLDIHSHLLMGKGEKNNFIKTAHASICADLFEALIGAIYLDGGQEAATNFFFNHFKEDVEEIIEQPLVNCKAELQDYTQKNYQKIPVYKVIEEAGPDHDKTFQISVFIDDRILGTGYGSSKKSAQQKAAFDALEKLNLSQVSE